MGGRKEGVSDRSLIMGGGGGYKMGGWVWSSFTPINRGGGRKGFSLVKGGKGFEGVLTWDP